MAYYTFHNKKNIFEAFKKKKKKKSKIRCVEVLLLKVSVSRAELKEWAVSE